MPPFFPPFYSGLTRHITAAAATLRMTTPNAVDTVVGSENGDDDITGSSFTSPLTIELANESVTGEFVHGSEVIGARWTLDSGVSS
jgi:hypothetical protein